MANFFGFGNNEKISDNRNSTQNGNDGNSNQNGNDGNQNQNGNQNGGNQGDDGQNDWLGDLYGAEADKSEFEIDESFFQNDDDSNDGQNNNGNDGNNQGGQQGDSEEQRIMNEAMTAMKGEIDKAFMEDKDFADWDVNDQTKVRALIDKSMKRSAAVAVSAVQHMMKPVLERAVAEMRKEFQTHIATNQVKSKAEQAFDPIQRAIQSSLPAEAKGLVGFARDTYQNVLRRTKDYTKAQGATIQLLRTMGVQIDLKNGKARKAQSFGRGNDGFEDFGGGQSSQATGMKTGDAALDSFFPSSARR